MLIYIDWLRTMGAMATMCQKLVGSIAPSFFFLPDLCENHKYCQYLKISDEFENVHSPIIFARITCMIPF